MVLQKTAQTSAEFTPRREQAHTGKRRYGCLVKKPVATTTILMAWEITAYCLVVCYRHMHNNYYRHLPLHYKYFGLIKSSGQLGNKTCGSVNLSVCVFLLNYSKMQQNCLADTIYTLRCN